MPSFVIESNQTAAGLESDLNTALAGVLNGVFFDARVTVVEATRVNGTELVVALSYGPAVAPITTPYQARVLEAKTASALQTACNAFVAANPTYFISQAIATRYVTARRVDSYVAILFYNTDNTDGVANWGIAGAPGSPATIAWGSITGVLTNQLDLVAALSATQAAAEANSLPTPAVLAALPAVATPATTDEMYAVQGGVAKRLTAPQVLTGALGGVGNAYDVPVSDGLGGYTWGERARYNNNSPGRIPYWDLVVEQLEARSELAYNWVDGGVISTADGTYGAAFTAEVGALGLAEFSFRNSGSYVGGVGYSPLPTPFYYLYDLAAGRDLTHTLVPFAGATYFNVRASPASTAAINCTDLVGDRAIALQYDFVSETGLLWGGEYTANGLMEWNDNNSRAAFDRDYAYDWIFGGGSPNWFDSGLGSYDTYLNNLRLTVTAYSGSQALPTVAGGYFRYTGTGGDTFTLPAANVSFGASGNPQSSSYTAFGRVIRIKNRGTGNLTVARAGADTIEGATSLTLTPGQGVDLIAISTSSWDVL